MVQLVDIPAEVLAEVLLQVYLSESSDIKDSLDEDLKHSDAARRDYSISKILNKSFQGINGAAYAYKTANMFDLYEIMCEDRCRRNSLLALSLTWKWLNKMVEPILWGLVELDQRDGGRVEDLRCTLLEKQGLGNLVKALEIRHFDEIAEVDEKSGKLLELTSILSLENDVPPEIGTHPVSSLLDRLPQLQSMKITLQNIPSYWSVFSASSYYMCGFPAGLQNLTELCLRCERPDGEVLDAWDLLPLFRLPNIKTLYIGQPVVVTLESTPPVEVAQYIGKSPVKNLTIDFAIMEEPALRTYLTLPAALESFTFSYDCFSNEDGSAEIQEIYESLLPQRSSLKKISMRSYPPVRVYKEKNSAKSGILKKFQALEELSLPFRFLLRGCFSFSCVLPQQLKRLNLYAVHEDWRFGRWEDGMDGFLDYRKSENTFDALEKVFVEYWLKSVCDRDDGQEGPLSCTEAAPFSATVARMKEDFRNSGIILEVDLDLESDPKAW